MRAAILLPRQLAENGLKPDQCQWDDPSLKRIITDYTHEAGVRELERQIGAVCRGVAAEIARGEQQSVIVTPDVVTVLLGPPRYVRERALENGCAGCRYRACLYPDRWRSPSYRGHKYPGKGGITLTGQIGNVMKESVQAALSLLRGRAEALGIDADAFKDTDIHVHVPAGAIPKDGPSAGVAMFTALASLFTNRRARADVGMTGEITLRGLVLPIGGLKEKSLAAMRAGLETVIIPKLNEKDLPDVPAEAREKLRFVPVENVDEVLANALTEPVAAVQLRATRAAQCLSAFARGQVSWLLTFRDARREAARASVSKPLRRCLFFGS